LVGTGIDGDRRCGIGLGVREIGDDDLFEIWLEILPIGSK
jgi:hypothetical protein